MGSSGRVAKPNLEGWIRKLDGDRLEIFLKVERDPGQPDRKIRASGPADEMDDLRSWFEEKTGRRIESPILPRRVPKPMPGSMTMFDLPEPTSAQLESGDTDG